MKKKWCINTHPDLEHFSSKPLREWWSRFATWKSLQHYVWSCFFPWLNLNHWGRLSEAYLFRGTPTVRMMSRSLTTNWAYSRRESESYWWTKSGEGMWKRKVLKLSFVRSGTDLSDYSNIVHGTNNSFCRAGHKFWSSVKTIDILYQLDRKLASNKWSQSFLKPLHFCSLIT